MTTLDTPLCADGCGRPATRERPTSCGGTTELVCSEAETLEETR